MTKRNKNKPARQKTRKVKKIKPFQSTQQNVPVSDFVNGLVLDKEGNFSRIIEVIPSPYLSKKNDEKNRIAIIFNNFIRFAPDEFHIKCVTEPANLSAQIHEIEDIIDNKEDPSCDKMRREYLKHLRDAEERTISRRYFISIPYEGKVPKTSPSYYAEAANALNNKASTLITILQQCGDAVVQSDNSNMQTAEIFYSLLNRKTSKQLSIEDRVAEINAKYISSDPVKYAEGVYVPPTEYIAPSRIDFLDPGFVKCDDTYYSYLFLPSKNFPSRVVYGWLSQFCNIAGVDVDIFYRRADSQVQSFTLNRMIARQTVAVQESSRKVSDATYESRGKLASANYLRGGLAAGDSIYNIAVVITVSGSSPQIVEEKKKYLKESAVKADMRFADLLYQEETAFRCTLPLPKIDDSIFKKAKRNVLTEGAASTYPFTSYELINKDGNYIADDLSTGSPVIPDLFDQTINSNPHLFICGETGSGKSVALKLIAMRQRVRRNPVFIIAPEKESEFKRIADEFDGQFVQLGNGSNTRLNIFDIFIPDKKAREISINTEGIDPWLNSVLPGKVALLISFFSLFDKEINKDLEMKEVLSEAIIETYQRFGITEDNKSLWKNEDQTELKDMPVISDLTDTLKEKNESHAIHLGKVLSLLIKGEGSYFNGRTNVNVENDFFVIGLENNSANMLGLATFVATEYIWNKVRVNKLQKKSIIMDEWWKMAYNPIAAERTMEIARLARAYSCSLVIATQQMRDVMALEDGKYGEAVLNSCATKIILHMQTKDLNSMQKMINLTASEQEAVSKFQPGQALMINSIARLYIAFQPSDYEKMLTFTDNKTLAAIMKNKMLNRTSKTDNNLTFDFDEEDQSTDEEILSFEDDDDDEAQRDNDSEAEELTVEFIDADTDDENNYDWEFDADEEDLETPEENNTELTNGKINEDIKEKSTSHNANEVSDNVDPEMENYSDLLASLYQNQHSRKRQRNGGGSKRG